MHVKYSKTNNFNVIQGYQLKYVSRIKTKLILKICNIFSSFQYFVYARDYVLLHQKKTLILTNPKQIKFFKPKMSIPLMDILVLIVDIFKIIINTLCLCIPAVGYCFCYIWMKVIVHSFISDLEDEEEISRFVGFININCISNVLSQNARSW